MDQNPETRKTLYPSASNGVKKDNKNDDDEIPSDSENEEKDDDDDDDNGDKMETEENSLKLQPLKRKAGFVSNGILTSLLYIINYIYSYLKK